MSIVNVIRGNRGTSAHLLGNAMLLGIFMLLGGGLILITGEVESSTLARMVWAGVYCVTLLCAYQTSRALLYNIQRNASCMLLAVLCLLSIIWTSHRPSTVSASIAFSGSTLVAYLMAIKIEPLRLLRIAAVGVFILVVMNFLLMLPNFGNNLGSGIRYSGFLPHPNMLGRLAGLGVVLFIVLTFSGEFPLLLASVGVVMSGLLAVSSDSMTSLVAALFSLVLFLLRKMIGRPIGTGHIAVSVWFVICLSGLVWVNWSMLIEYAFGLMGRSTSLTGRAGLWSGVWDAILNKPFLGYGYAGFWSGERLITKQLLDAAGWSTSSAHNGLFDIALHLGFVGVAVFAVGIWRSLMTGLKFAFRRDSVLAVILLSLLCYLIILGVTESAYMMRNSIYWVLIVVCSVYLRRLRDGEFLNATIDD